MLTIKKIVPETFVSKYIPIMIYNYILGQSSTQRYKVMQSYFKENLNLNLNEVIKEICDNYKVTAINNYYIVKLSNVKHGDYELSALLRLIDKGTMSTKGTNIFTDAYKYIKENAGMIYLLYQVEGEEHVS